MLQFCAGALGPCNQENSPEDGTFAFPRAYFKRIADSPPSGCQDSKIEMFQSPGNAGFHAAQTSQDIGEIGFSVTGHNHGIWTFQMHVDVSMFRSYSRNI